MHLSLVYLIIFRYAGLLWQDKEPLLENNRNDVQRRVVLPIKEVKTEIASKLPVDPATRSPSPVEENSNMSVRDKINRFKMNETLDNDFQRSPQSSRPVINTITRS